MKVISGGQTGADQGALSAAKQLGLETGGWMPRSFMTEAGPRPEFAEQYGMKEHHTSTYPPRTRENVKDADLTVWTGPLSAYDFGYQCTLKACIDQHKPILVNPEPELLKRFILGECVQVLNVAGPRKSKDVDAFRRASELIIATFGGDK